MYCILYNVHFIYAYESKTVVSGGSRGGARGAIAPPLHLTQLTEYKDLYIK